MLQCTKRLVPCQGEEDFYLVEATKPPEHGRSLEKLIPDFFSCRKYGIRIAAVCGLDTTWSSEEFAETLKKCAANRKDKIIPWDKNRLQAVCVANICASTADENGMDKESAMGAFFETIYDICSSINENLNGDKDNADIVSAKTCVVKACTQMKTLAQYPDLIIRNGFAKDITACLGDRENHVVRNGFPTVMILVFLPESVFNVFEDQKNNFFKQIEYVLHFEDPERQMLEEELSAALAEVKQLKAELEEAKRIKDARIAELEDLLKKALVRYEQLRADAYSLEALQDENIALKSENASLREELVVEKEKTKVAITRQLCFGSCFVWHDIRYEKPLLNFLKDEVQLDEHAMEYPISHPRFQWLPRNGNQGYQVDLSIVNDEITETGSTGDTVYPELKTEREIGKKQEKKNEHIQDDDNIMNHYVASRGRGDDRGI